VRVGAEGDELHETRFYHTALAKLRIPRGAFTLVKEVARHLLRRPVVGIAAAARTPDGRWLLIRRGDVGEWALAGGTLEWGETLRTSIARELLEEAGVERCEIVRLAGVYSRPDRDPRFHGVTVVVECVVDPPTRPPANPLEITEVGLFAEADLPRPLAFGMEDMLEVALSGGEPVVE
jgi:8-oxo-dGTP diphosphatase